MVIQYTHANEAQVRKIGCAVSIALGQGLDLFEILWEVKGDLQESFLH